MNAPIGNAPTTQFSITKGGGGLDSLNEYYYALKSGFWLILLCALLGALWGIGQQSKQKSMFRARSILCIEQVKSGVLGLNVTEVSNDDIRSVDQINTLVALLHSNPFALRVVNSMKLYQDREFLTAAGIKTSETSPENAETLLLGMVTSNYRVSTRLIDIFATTSDGQLSVKLANGYAEEYLRYERDQRNEAIKTASGALMEESDQLRKKMKVAEEGMQKFREREHTTSFESMIQGAQAKVTELATQENLLQAKLTQINTDLETFKSQSGNIEDLLRLPSVAGEGKLATLATQLTGQEHQFVLVKQRYRDWHPMYISLKTQINLTRSELSSELADVAKHLESLKISLPAQLDTAKAAREDAEKHLMEVSGKSIEYTDLNRELASDMALYDAVLHRIKEVDVTKELADSSVQLQEHATGAYSVGKGPLNIIVQSLLYGLGLGVVLSLALYKIDTSLKSVEQVENLTGLDVLAAIPGIAGSSTLRLGFFSKKFWQDFFSNPSLTMLFHPYRATVLLRGKELVTKEDRKGVVAESFRSLRATVAMNIQSENQKVFLFTSALPSEGKSFCSANFSITLAQQGLKVLLIDADLRKPSISRIFYGLNRKPGLSEVLLDQTSLPEAVHDSGVDGLTVLTAGGLSPNPAELLTGRSFQALVTEALTHYDRVVIDSAPLLAVSDTYLIAPAAEVICLVVRSFLTPGKSVKRAIKSLSDFHIRPTGVILNCLPQDRQNEYSGRYYGSYGSKGVYGSAD